MTNPNKAELRRLTIQRDIMGTIQIMSGDFDYVQIRYQYPYTDNASTQRLAEQVVAILEGRSEVEQLRAERDAALAELKALRIQVGTLTEWYSNALDVISEVTAAIPGVTYMDPPDGGDVSIPEQIRRMAKDAGRYRWLRMADWWSSSLCVIRSPKKQAKPGTDCPSRDRLDSAIDEAMSQEAPNA